MRWYLTMSILATAACPAIADDKDAEKLYRAMEQKVRNAKTLQLRYELSITDAKGKKGNIKGTLLLGEGDKLRMDADGKLFGETLKWSAISDGTKMKSIDVPDQPKQPKLDESAEGMGIFLRKELPRRGFFTASLNLQLRKALPDDDFKQSEFKFLGKEKIGERNTQAIQYAVRWKEQDPILMTIWLDTGSHLPVKLAMTGGESDVTDLTETYSEFKIDERIDPKQFELPK